MLQTVHVANTTPYNTCSHLDIVVESEIQLGRPSAGCFPPSAQVEALSHFQPIHTTISMRQQQCITVQRPLNRTGEQATSGCLLQDGNGSNIGSSKALVGATPKLRNGFVACGRYPNKPRQSSRLLPPTPTTPCRLLPDRRPCPVGLSEGSP